MSDKLHPLKPGMISPALNTVPLARPAKQDVDSYQPKAKSLPTPKGWQGFTKAVPSPWDIPAQPPQPKAEAPKAKPKPRRPKGARLIVGWVDKATTNDLLPTAKEAHTEAKELFELFEVRWCRVVTPSGQATLYRVAGRHISARELAQLTRDEATKVARQETRAYEKPGQLTRLTYNGRTMASQRAKNSPRGQTWARIERAQGLGAHNR